jgi:hypothetical protein
MARIQRLLLSDPRRRTAIVCDLNRIQTCGLLAVIFGLFLVLNSAFDLRPHVFDASSLLHDAGNKTALSIFSKESDAITIAFAVTITSCSSSGMIQDGAAVLLHSIHRASVYGPLGGRYNYAAFAFYHPSAEKCAAMLEPMGWKLLPRRVFVNVSDIRGDILRMGINQSGCCGAKELIKLEAYTLTDYPVVVHLDLDTIVLKPLDDVFDIMLATDRSDFSKYTDILMQHRRREILNHLQINAVFTYDYNMAEPGVKYNSVQGGFMVLRPSATVYEEFRQIVLEGDFRDGVDGSGWGGKVEPIYGGMTFQGIIPYYYDVLHPGQHLELNRCVYNNMCDNPRIQSAENATEPGACITGEVVCEDCRARPSKDIVTAHFTLCGKPWWCPANEGGSVADRLCQDLLREWYRMRSELEQSWERSTTGPADYLSSHFFGYCNGNGDKSYLPIQQPYGRQRG